jgi:hypothetical protein
LQKNDFGILVAIGPVLRRSSKMVLGTWVTGSGMPSAHYYVEQAKALLSWAQATKDEGKETRLHAQAAKELERAKQAVEPADRDPLLSEFNDGQMLKGGGKSVE